jgi:hypothetical protein
MRGHCHRLSRLFPLFWATTLLLCASIGNTQNSALVDELDKASDIFLDGLSSLLRKIDEHHKKTAKYDLDVTKAIDSQSDVLEELSGLDEFIRSASVERDVMYLPVFLQFRSSMAEIEHLSPGLDRLGCRDANQVQQCVPVFLSGPALEYLYTKNELDDSAYGPVANFVRNVIDHHPSAVFSQPLPIRPDFPLVEQSFGSQPMNPNGNAVGSWFADPCNSIAQSGWDPGGRVVIVGPGFLDDDRLTSHSSCITSNGMGEAQRLTKSEFAQFQQIVVGIVFKNQPSPEDRGKPVDYTGHNLETLAARSQYAERYLRYVEIRPTPFLPTRADDPYIKSLIAQNRYKYPDDVSKLSLFEAQVMRQVFSAARSSLYQLRFSKAPQFKNIRRIEFVQSGWFDVGALSDKPGVVSISPTAIRATFLQCHGEVDQLIRFLRAERECQSNGGTVRQDSPRPTVDNSIVTTYQPKEKNQLDHARDHLRPFVCGEVNKYDAQSRIVNEFNSCLVNDLWFLMNHEMAHIYLANEGRVEQDEDRADCYALLYGLRTRPNADLGVFETIVVGGAAENMDLNVGQFKLQSVRTRYLSLKEKMLPLARKGVLSDAVCDRYSSAHPSNLAAIVSSSSNSKQEGE